ncbi:MAG: hypothetical protein ACK5XD_09000 [Acidobacteriota bacterium]
MSLLHPALRAGLAAALMVTLAQGVETQFWVNNSRGDYEKATLKRLALRSDGRLTLAPAVKELFDPSVSYLWAAARDSKGTLYTGGGNPGSTAAKLFAINSQGQGRAAAELPGLQIQAIAIDARDQVFVATSPDGKVYRIAADGKANVFYDPRAKYIWALAFSPAGDLYVGTGDRGEIHKVTPAGAGQVFFKADDEHIRSLAVTPAGDLIAGTEPSGLILRVNSAGGFVLHQSAKREITALAVAPDGALSAAGVGNKSAASAPAPPPVPLPPPAPAAAPGGMTVTVTARTPAPAPTPSPSSVSGGSELLRIAPDGFPTRLWSDAAEVIYSICLDTNGKPVIGTGNKGGLYRIDSELVSTKLLTLAPTQVTALLAVPKGPILAVTGNIGKVYAIGPELEKDGTLESEIMDAGVFSEWGRIEPKVIANGGAVKWETRTGNVDRAQSNWSPWAPVAERVASPAARFLQYRMTLTGPAELVHVELAYLPRNVAPLVEAIEITPANYRFPVTVPGIAPASTLSLPGMSSSAGSSASAPSADPGPATLNYSKGSQSARWKAADPNADKLTYTVEIRGRGEKDWKLLKDQVTTRSLSWDGQAFPDGEYQLRVTASDAPANVPAKALRHALESDWFLIDNSVPRITGLRAQNDAVTWTATDDSSLLPPAEYSLNGGDWTIVEPVSRLHDAKQLRYSLPVTKVAGKETVVAVRVTDYADNAAVARIVVP